MPWRPVPEEATEEGECYVLHFHEPLGTARQQARHYIGFGSYAAGGAAARIAVHRAGNGSRLMQVLRHRGIGFEVAQVIPNCTRADERRLKNRGGASRVCRICRGESPLPGKGEHDEEAGRTGDRVCT